MENKASISICVPALNEEKNLREAVLDLLKTLSSYLERLEVIIVDDGSTDSTPQIAMGLAREYPQVKVIHHFRNLGVGVCYRDALFIAREEYFTWFPADHENSAEQFVQSLPYLGHDTIVTFHHQGQDNRRFLRKAISSIYTRAINKIFHLNLKYYNDLTVFPIRLLRSLPLAANASIFWAESIIKAIVRGSKVVELPAPLKTRNFGASKILTISSLIKMVKDIFYIFIQQKNISERNENA